MHCFLYTAAASDASNKLMIMTSGWGLQHRPTSPITKIQYTNKIKIDNKAVQKLHTS